MSFLPSLDFSLFLFEYPVSNIYTLFFKTCKNQPGCTFGSRILKNKVIMKRNLKRIIQHIEAGEYKAAHERLALVMKAYPEEWQLEVAFIETGIANAMQEKGQGRRLSMGFYAQSAAWRLKDILGHPAAAECLQTLHKLVDFTATARCNSLN